MSNLIVGCPVQSNRLWVFDKYLEHAQKAMDHYMKETGELASFLFLVSANDDKMLEAVESFDHVIMDEPVVTANRYWSNTDRYVHMANVRETLLEAVRERAPDYFLSLDSDILIPETLITNLTQLQITTGVDAVGSITWLAEVDPKITNAAVWSDHTKTKWCRVPSEGMYVTCDILMAIILMTPQAYSISYQPSRDGEDLGWARNASGLKQILSYQDPSKHIMNPGMLDQIDYRTGW